MPIKIINEAQPTTFVGTGPVMHDGLTTKVILDIEDRLITNTLAGAGIAYWCKSFERDPDGLVVGRSRARARGAEFSTLDIFGQHGSTSSESVVLQRSLESRLRAGMASRGSTLFDLTWNDAVTPSGHRICALRASARRTSDSDCTSWPSPLGNDAKGSDYAYGRGSHEHVYLKLGGSEAHGWATPVARDWKRGGEEANCRRRSSWSTPAAREAGGTAEGFLMRKRRAKAKGASLGESLTSLSMQVQLIGPASPGSTAPTASSDPSPQTPKANLNPRFSLWLNGYPIAWAFCGEAVTRSSQPSPPRSSKRRSRR